MKVIRNYSVHHDGKEHKEGEVMDVPNDVAEAWIQSGAARGEPPLAVGNSVSPCPAPDSAIGARELQSGNAEEPVTPGAEEPMADGDGETVAGKVKKKGRG